MTSPESRQRRQLLEEVERRVGHVGYAEAWLNIPAPRHASAREMERWRTLSTEQKIRVADRYDRVYAEAKEQVFNDWSRRQHLKNSIRTGSVCVAMATVFLLCFEVYNILPAQATHNAIFLPMWWLTSLAMMAGLYLLLCHLGERWFARSEDNGLRMR